MRGKGGLDPLHGVLRREAHDARERELDDERVDQADRIAHGPIARHPTADPSVSSWTSGWNTT
jgi:hypothetical protein